nr:hypothetical protein [Tanacetum cinerariifolium]
MITYLKNMAGYKMEFFKGMTYDKESFKKLRAAKVSGSESTQEITSNDPKEKTGEDVQNMLEIIPVPEFKVKALQVKYPIIEWEIQTKDMLKGFDREDLVALWKLVKEKFSSAEPSDDKEKALLVEQKRLFELDENDVLWKTPKRRNHVFNPFNLIPSCFGLRDLRSDTSVCDDVGEPDAATIYNAKATSVRDDVGVHDDAYNYNAKATSVRDDVGVLDDASDYNAKATRVCDDVGVPDAASYYNAKATSVRNDVGVPDVCVPNVCDDIDEVDDNAKDVFQPRASKRNKKGTLLSDCPPVIRNYMKEIQLAHWEEKLHDEEVQKAVARDKQGRADMERALELQR